MSKARHWQCMFSLFRRSDYILAEGCEGDAGTPPGCAVPAAGRQNNWNNNKFRFGRCARSSKKYERLLIPRINSG
jgi:hypothetical protein